MKVIVCNPKEKAKVMDIADNLNVLQAIVCGPIQIVYPFSDMVCIVCNDEGKNMNLPLNRSITDELSGDIVDIIAGPFLICGTGEDDLTSLSEDDISKYMDMFGEPEDW